MLIERPMFHQVLGVLQQCGILGNGIPTHTVQRSYSFLFLFPIQRTSLLPFTIGTVKILFLWTQNCVRTFLKLWRTLMLIISTPKRLLKI
jgi:hypothetical protein